MNNIQVILGMALLILATSLIANYGVITGFAVKDTMETEPPEISMRMKCERSRELVSKCIFNCKGVVYNSGGHADNVEIWVTGKGNDDTLFSGTLIPVGEVPPDEFKEFEENILSHCNTEYFEREIMLS